MVLMLSAVSKPVTVWSERVDKGIKIHISQATGEDQEALVEWQGSIQDTLGEFAVLRPSATLVRVQSGKATMDVDREIFLRWFTDFLCGECVMGFGNLPDDDEGLLGEVVMAGR